ncbi:hypothetical protein WI71_14605 [Burkholderia diffusa]|nr:hypothetical protein WI71_14605 [Burkholderia diffusa]
MRDGSCSNFNHASDCSIHVDFPFTAPDIPVAPDSEMHCQAPPQPESKHRPLEAGQCSLDE